ncbi:porin family protein [Flavobacterium facile]|uniref:porin family protein n=1 Tax=Flavobacterium facile TaxID=2893174 RepID=UPI002E76BC55|nr:porin family protein [Flavobacterium sp. T-12]
MKKALYLFAIILGGITIGNAQVTFKPGIRGGLNMSHFSKGNDANYYSSYYGNNGNRGFESESKTSLYVGFFGDLKLTKYYSLQPELNYSRQGSSVFNYDNNGAKYTTDYDLSYLSVGVANKFTFNKFNVHVGPTIDFLIDNKVTATNINNNYNNYYGWDGTPIDLSFFLGAGYDITSNFGVEARIKKGIIPVIDSSYGNHTNVVFSVGAFYKFDVK